MTILSSQQNIIHKWQNLFGQLLSMYYNHKLLKTLKIYNFK